MQNNDNNINKKPIYAKFREMNEEGLYVKTANMLKERENSNDEEGELLFKIDIPLNPKVEIKPNVDYAYYEMNKEQKDVFDSLYRADFYEQLEDNFIEIANFGDINDNETGDINDYDIDTEIDKINEPIKQETLENKEIIDIINEDIKNLNIDDNKQIEDNEIDDKCVNKLKKNEIELERKVINKEGEGTIILRKVKKITQKCKNEDSKIKENYFENKSINLDESEEISDNEVEAELNEELYNQEEILKNNEDNDTPESPTNIIKEYKKECPFVANNTEKQAELNKLYDDYLLRKNKTKNNSKNNKKEYESNDLIIDADIKNNTLKLYQQQLDKSSDTDDMYEEINEVIEKNDIMNNIGKCKVAEELNSKPNNYYNFNIIKEDIETEQRKNKEKIQKYKEQKNQRKNSEKKKIQKQKEKIEYPKVQKNESPNTKKERKQKIKNIKKEIKENKRKFNNEFNSEKNRITKQKNINKMNNDLNQISAYTIN